MKNLTVTEMNNAIANNTAIAWRSHACKDSALAGRIKKLVPKVNSIVKEMDLDPDAVNVEFENVKLSGEAMFDVIYLSGDCFEMTVEFHNSTKESAGYVSMAINTTDGEADSVECETWKELKGILSEYSYYTQCECEDCVNDPEEEDEVEEADEVEEELEGEMEEEENKCEDFDPEQVED